MKVYIVRCTSISSEHRIESFSTTSSIFTDKEKA